MCSSDLAGRLLVTPAQLAKFRHRHVPGRWLQLHELQIPEGQRVRRAQVAAVGLGDALAEAKVFFELLVEEFHLGDPAGPGIA